MGVNESEVRRRRTSQVAKWNKEKKNVENPNGYKGRSQKGCFGGKGAIHGKTKR